MTTPPETGLMKFFGACKRAFRLSAEQAAGQIDVSLADKAKMAIDDAKNEIARLEAAIIDLDASTRNLRRQKENADKQAADYGKYAANAVEQGNDTHATTLLQNQVDAEEASKAFQAQIKANEAQFATYNKQIQEYRKRINQASGKLTQLKTAQQAAETRQALADVASTTANGSPFAALDDLEGEVNQMTDHAAATENMAALESEASGDNLVKKYSQGDQTAEINNRLAALKAKKTTEEQTTGN